jgi:hypothetical protein
MRRYVAALGITVCSNGVGDLCPAGGTGTFGGTCTGTMQCL